MFKLDLEKAEEPEIKLPTFVGSSKKQESFRKTSTFALGGSDGKASDYNAGDPGSIPGLGRSPGEGNGIPLLPGKFHGLRGSSEPGRLQSMGSQRVGHD